jgi:hypothetical protein
MKGLLDLTGEKFVLDYPFKVWSLTVLISPFLIYFGFNHDIALSTWNEDSKIISSLFFFFMLYLCGFVFSAPAFIFSVVGYNVLRRYLSSVIAIKLAYVLISLVLTFATFYLFKGFIAIQFAWYYCIVMMTLGCLVSAKEKLR